MEEAVAESENPLKLGDETVEEEEVKTSGFVKKLISNMVSTEGNESKKEEKGGILSNLISNLVSPLSTKETAEVAINGGDSELVEEVRGGGGNVGGGGGIIDSIVSHLPASIQGDTVTTTDEATILIHSIVHD